MKSTGLRMITSLTCAAIVFALTLDADAQRKKSKPDASPAASVTQVLGINSHVTITYHRPGVKGREGKIYNSSIVPYGGTPMPWRAGANENTIIEFEHNVKIEGEDLAAGAYGFHIIPSDGEWTLVFSKNVKGWGSFGYKAEDDALRVNVSPGDSAHQEWLVFTFEDLSAESATAVLRWESKKVGFKIELNDPSALSAD